MSNSKETFKQVRWYPNAPYLRFFSQSLRLRFGSVKPTVVAFLLQRKNEWGDPLPFDLTGYTIMFRLYDKNSNLITEGVGAVGPTNDDTGEINYEWQEFDIQQPGTYYGEFVLVNEDKKLIEPDSLNRLYITVI